MLVLFTIKTQSWQHGNALAQAAEMSTQNPVRRLPCSFEHLLDMHPQVHRARSNSVCNRFDHTTNNALDEAQITP